MYETMTDSELVRSVMSSKTSTRLEKELAVRCDRLLYAVDAVDVRERTFLTANQSKAVH